jgi:creatinine amidohydrolase
VRFEDMTLPEIGEAADRGAVVLVPTGCTEQQGPHLPVGFDTWFAQRLACDASVESERGGVPTLVMPTLPFGPTPEHRGFGAGYVDLPIEVHDAVVLALLRSVIKQGFRKVLVLRGCGGHDLRDVVTTVRAEDEGVVVSLPDMPFGEMWNRIGDASVPGGHADSFTTSIALALWPQSVRLDAIPGPSLSPDWEREPLDFTDWSESGVIGDPRFGSADLGRKLYEAAVKWLVTQIGDLANTA